MCKHDEEEEEEEDRVCYHPTASTVGVERANNIYKTLVGHCERVVSLRNRRFNSENASNPKKQMQAGKERNAGLYW